MGDNILKLELTLDEVNNILYALSDRPYKDVYELIAKVRLQAEPQVKQYNP